MGSAAKIQEYFASMSPLSARISSDIRNIENTILNHAGDDGDENEKANSVSSLTYSQKCAAIDKYLIDDVIQKANAKARLKSNKPLNVQISKCNSSTTNHLNSLILAAYPAKPEKYVFEEAGGVWLDEHSAPFSFCKISQAKCCSLGKSLIHNAAKNEPEEIPLSMHKNYGQRNGCVKQAVDLNKSEVETVEVHATNDDREQSVRKPCPERPKQQPKGRQFFGVNVMGNQTKQEVIRTRNDDQDQNELDETEDEIQEMEDKLPQQKQNLQLIAELQAKLKKTNQIHEETTAGVGECKIIQPIEEPKCKKELVKVKEPEILKQKKSEKRSKIKKPKAPPPPPPPNPPKSESVHSPSPLAKEQTTAARKDVSQGKQHQVAVAMSELKNVLSGAKLKSSVLKSKAPSAGMATATQPQPPPPPVPSSSSAVTKVTNEPIASKKVEPGAAAGGGGAEFCVDVSSPCKIATPKTGLEILDNW